MSNVISGKFGEDPPNRLKEIRKARGMTLAEVAKIVGSTTSQISKLERGTRRLNLDWMDKLASIYSCSRNELFSGLGDGGDPVVDKLRTEVSELEGRISEIEEQKDMLWKMNDYLRKENDELKKRMSLPVH